MSEAKYWEEYDAAKKAALKMAAQLSAREKGVMVQGLRWAMSKEARHNEESRQGKFEESFRSLDLRISPRLESRYMFSLEHK